MPCARTSSVVLPAGFMRQTSRLELAGSHLMLLPRFLRPCLSVAALLCLACGPANAIDLTELYTTQAIVTGTGETNRRPGLEQCLRGVLVKVSGDPRVLHEPAVLAALPQAGAFVSDFRYRDRLEGVPIHDEQGTHDRPHDLTCVFARETIDALLQKAGRKPWLDPRPGLIAFLAVRQANKAFVLSRNGGDGVYMRDSLEAAAAPLALTVGLPDAATLASAALNADTLPKVEMADLDAIAHRYDSARALGGNLVWSDEDRGWVADWRLEAGGQIYTWQVRGVSFDEAFRQAIAGSLRILSGNGAP